MKTYFQKLLKYNEWANNRVLEVLIGNQVNSSDILQQFSHIISAQKLWLDRIQNNQIIYEFWNTESLEGCIQMSKESSMHWLKFLESADSGIFERKVKYVTSKGQEYENTIEDILVQLVNHSTYHRAQIAKLLRLEDITPPVTDYIVFRRENK